MNWSPGVIVENLEELSVNSLIIYVCCREKSCLHKTTNMKWYSSWIITDTKRMDNQGTWNDIVDDSGLKMRTI